MVAAGELADGLGGDKDTAARQNGGFAERAEVLGAAVAVGVIGIGWATAEPDGEKRQHGGYHVARGLDARGDETQRAGDDAGPELEQH